jgi:hypothetical protein
VLTGLVAYLSVACGAPTAGAGTTETAPAAAWSPATQISDANQVKIAVTWQGPDSGPVFQVAMDTHSVDLDGYDLLQLARLRTDQGIEVAPSRWDAPKGGHHRSGTLSFPTTTTGGSPVIGPSTGSVELLIRDVAGVPERTYRWSL